MTVIVLVDNRFNLTESLKKTAYETIANALSFNAQRGDKIIIRKVPFHYASQFASEGPITLPQNEGTEKIKAPSFFERMIKKNITVIIIAFAVALLAFFMALRARRNEGHEEYEPVAQPEPQKTGAVEQLRKEVAQAPDKIAELLKKWLSEEKKG